MCVLRRIFSILNSHTPLNLNIDLSFTRAPPHLIQALRAMTSMVIGVCYGVKRVCLCKALQLWPYVCIGKICMENHMLCKRKFMKRYVPWAFVGKANSYSSLDYYVHTRLAFGTRHLIGLEAFILSKGSTLIDGMSTKFL